MSAKARVVVAKQMPMDESNLMSVVRHSHSLDSRIEVPASWDEYERGQELLDMEGKKFPRTAGDKLLSSSLLLFHCVDSAAFF
ncbi:hypothetical protein V1522DRAFT_70477 [Lipomyces starkeyi]